MLRKMSCRTVVCGMLTAMGFAIAASNTMATVISPANGDFESPTVTAGSYANVTPTSWSASSNSGVDGNGATFNVVFHPQTGSDNLYDDIGSQLFAMECNPGNYARTGIQQDLGTMTAGQTYTFNATLYSTKSYGSEYIGRVISGYAISFYDVDAGTTLKTITQADYNPYGSSQSNYLSSIAATFSYAADSTTNGHELRLIMESGAADSNTWYRTGVDNVTVTTSGVPEPASMTLCVGAVLGLLAYAWRKQR